MTSHKQGATLQGLPDRFVAVEIETEALPAFDAAQYSFFGDFSAADSGLEGPLEDGLEAPPPEEGLSQDYGLHAAEEEPLPAYEEEDLSVATIFRNQLGLGPAKTQAASVEPDDDTGLDALLTDPLSVARKQLRDDDYDHRAEGLPAELYPAAVASAAVAVTQPQSLFEVAAASPYGLFDRYCSDVQGSSHAAAADDPSRAAGSAAMATQPLQPSLQPAPNAGAKSALLQMLEKPSQQLVHAVTLKELEARILGSTEAPAVLTAGQVALVDAGAAAGCYVPDSGAVGTAASGPTAPNALAAAGSNPQHQQSAGLLLFRPLPGTPAVTRGHATVGAAPLPSEAFSPQLPPGQRPGVNGMAPQPHNNYQDHMHGALESHGPMLVHMMPPGSSAGPAMYPPVNLMYSGNGFMPPPPSHHHHHPLGSGMLPQGPMGPPSYGPGGMYPPGGPMPSFSPGPMRGPLPYMQAGYPMRPMGQPPGMPVGPMHGVPPRPGPFGYDLSALGIGAGPGPQQQQQQMPAPPGPQRPPMMSGQPHLGAGGAQRLPPGVGSAGARLATPTARQAGGSQAASDSGQQSARTGGALTAAPVALLTAAGRTGGAPFGPGGRLGGKWMPPEDVEYVVRSMLYTVANGVPYVEDYYYQAFVHKHVSQLSRQQLSPCAYPMAAPFVPEALRELSEDQMSMMRLDPSSRAKFVEGLQGLGKIVLSNIRTPKVLMDLSDREVKAGDARAPTTSTAEGEGSTGVGKDSDQGAGGRGGARSLEQEPLLAARIMIEDCMNLLLDVDDIDRLANHMVALVHSKQRAAAVAAALPLGAGGALPNASVAVAVPRVGPYGPSSAALLPPTQLRHRREVLLAGIIGAFRLPNSPTGASVAREAGGLLAEGFMDLASGAGPARNGGSLGDGVLLRILALNKGRGIVARALLAIAPPASLGAAAATAAPPQAVRPSKQMHAFKSAPATAAAGVDTDVSVVVQGSRSDAQAVRSAAAAPLKLQEDAPAAGDNSGEGAASTSNLLGADVPSPFVLLWGTLRSAWMVFGTSLRQDLDSATERSYLEATSRLAVALREALLRLSSPRDVVDAAAAFNAGCQQHVEALCQGVVSKPGVPDADLPMTAKLLPLAQTRAVEAAAEQSAAPAAWLGEALAALLTRASQLGLAMAIKEAGGNDSGEPSWIAAAGSQEHCDEMAFALLAEWRREYNVLHVRLVRHLAALGEIHLMALAATSGSAEALMVVRALSCRLLVNAMLPHASEEQAQELKGALSALAV